MSDISLIIIGVVLVLAGFYVAGSGRKDSVRVGNTAVSVFGSIKQTFSSAGLAIKGERRRTGRDWIGWGLSACGVVVGLIGLFRP